MSHFLMFRKGGRCESFEYIRSKRPTPSLKTFLSYLGTRWQPEPLSNS